MEGNELTFDMIGNVSDDDIIEETEIEFAAEDINDVEDHEGVDEGKILEDTEEDDTQESVVDNQGEEDIIIEDDDSSSPDFYASIAKSLKKDGLFTLDDAAFEEVKSANDLANLFNKQLVHLLDEKQKRINDALNNNVPVDTIKQYENVLNYVNSITEEALNEETAEAEELRGNLIVQEYLNKGFSQERANREVQKSFDAGTDIEDAITALREVRSFYKESYDNVIKDSKAQKQSKLEEEREQSKKLEKMFLDNKEPIKGISLTEVERKNILNQYTKYVGKDENNTPLNAIQNYAKENPLEYQYNINLLYYLTNGFKDIGSVLNKQVKKKTKSALSNLERTLRSPNTQIGGGDINFGNDTSDDSYKGISVVLD